MTWVVVYIVGAIFTLTFWLWHCSKTKKLGRGALERIALLSILFPITWIWVLKNVLIIVVNFIYCEMRIWRKKHNDR